MRAGEEGQGQGQGQMWHANGNGMAIALMASSVSLCRHYAVLSAGTSREPRVRLGTFMLVNCQKHCHY